MNLIRDVLDNQIVDRDKHKMGKVDGITIELRDDAPPRLLYIQTGPTILARRLHPRLERWVAALGRKWNPRRDEPFRIDWSSVRDVGIDVEVDLQAEQTPALSWEQWICKHIIERIPGAG